MNGGSLEFPGIYRKEITAEKSPKISGQRSLIE
jgi:hypothetical protein